MKLSNISWGVAVTVWFLCSLLFVALVLPELDPAIIEPVLINSSAMEACLEGFLFAWTLSVAYLLFDAQIHLDPHGYYTLSISIAIFFMVATIMAVIVSGIAEMVRVFTISTYIAAPFFALWIKWGRAKEEKIEIKILADLFRIKREINEPKPVI